MFARELPYWCEFRSGVAMMMGPELCWRASELAAYFAATLQLERPGTDWAIETDKKDDGYRSTVLEVPSGPRFSPYETITVLAYRALAGKGSPELVAPTGLRDVFDVRAGAQLLTAESAPFHIARVEHGTFDYHIDIEVPTEDDDWLDRVVALIERPGVRAVREDREVILVESDLGLESLASVVEAAVSDAASPDSSR